MKWREYISKKKLAVPLILALSLITQISAKSQDANIDTTSFTRVSPINVEIDMPLLRPLDNDLIITKNNKYDLFPTRSDRGITNVLNNLLVVSHAQSVFKTTETFSFQEYLEYSGRTIASIKIHTLDPYGVNLDDVTINDIQKSSHFLNKTHVTTKGRVIQNNLFFSVGDTINPYLLSDNERVIRELDYIYDCRIIVMPASEKTVDVYVLTKDVYSLGADGKLRNGIGEGFGTVFEKNLLGYGHELGITIPYTTNDDGHMRIGIGLEYGINNIRKSFINTNAYFLDSMDIKKYGIKISRAFVNANTKYAGGLTIKRTSVKEEIANTTTSARHGLFDTKDVWLGRSFLLQESPVTRLVVGARYISNNAIKRPYVSPDSYQYYHDYQMVLGSLTFSSQEYQKNNLIYGYGRIEDIPYGGLFSFNLGKEFGEFKNRTYRNITASIGNSVLGLVYIYTSLGLASYSYKGVKEQGVFSARANIISNLAYIGSYKIRNFFRFEYTNGFNRYDNEYIEFERSHGFSGFSSDSTRGINRVTFSLESVLFSPKYRHGFRFAYYVFGDLGYLYDAQSSMTSGHELASIGLGVRIRNDNLVLNTISIRFSYFVKQPPYSSVRNMILSGEQYLCAPNFEPGAPSILPYYILK